MITQKGIEVNSDKCEIILNMQSNNEVEYEVLIARLKLAHELGVKKPKYYSDSDSQLVTIQVNREYQAKKTLPQKYYHNVKNLN